MICRVKVYDIFVSYYRSNAYFRMLVNDNESRLDALSTRCDKWTYLLQSARLWYDCGMEANKNKFRFDKHSPIQSLLHVNTHIDIDLASLAFVRYRYDP